MREQAIFDTLFIECRKICKTYDFKPMSDVPYPFIEFEDTEVFFVPNKTDIRGSVIINLSVWGLRKKRKELTDIVNKIFDVALDLRKAGKYSIRLNTRKTTIKFIDDDSTVEPLKRAILSLEFDL